MTTFFRHFLLTLSVVLLLGHNTVAHAHGCETGGKHTDDIIHQLGDFFGTDLGQGHLAHFGIPQGAETEGESADLQPALLPAPYLLALPAIADATAELLPSPLVLVALHLQGHGNAWGLRGPPAKN